jgi:hypothetical protein
MKHLIYILFVLALFILTERCGNQDTYRQKIRTLDSLGGAVNAMLGELQRTDTVMIQRSISKYGYYRQFIRQQVNDTLTKPEADVLQQFFSAGKRLESYSHNRLTVLARARLLNSQLVKLTADAREQAIDEESLSRFAQQEHMEAARLMRTGYEQQKTLYQAQKDFSNSLKGVEQLIRARNNGSLPTVIRDTVDM